MKTFLPEYFDESTQTLTLPKGDPNQRTLLGEGIRIKGYHPVYSIVERDFKPDGTLELKLQSIGITGSVGSGPGPIGEIDDLGPVNLNDETMDSIPAPAYGGFVQADNVEINNHIDMHSNVMRVWKEGTEENPEKITLGHVTWKEVDRNEKAPKDCNIPVTREALQKLFDSLWRAGYRPTGTTVTLETVKVQEPQEGYVQAVLDEVQIIYPEQAMPGAFEIEELLKDKHGYIPEPPFDRPLTSEELEALPDECIDTSDIPEQGDEFGNDAKVVKPDDKYAGDIQVDHVTDYYPDKEK